MSRPAPKSLAAGFSATVAAAVAVHMVGPMTGLVSRPHLLVLPIGVAAAALAAWIAHRRPADLPFRVGAGVAGAGALAAELLFDNGIGALQVAAVAASVAAAVGGSRLLSPLTRRIPLWAPVVGLVAVAMVLIRVVIGGGELGHDEAAYALEARAWLEGTPHTGWGIHRGVAQSVVAAVVLPFGQAAEHLRLVSVVGSLGTIVAVWWLGRTVVSNRVGLVAAGVFAVAPSFLRRGAEFLTDVPSTGLLLVSTSLVWRWARRSDAGPGLLLWASAVGTLAVYFRYQSVLTLGLLAVAAVVVFSERVRTSARSVAAAVGLGLGLLVPHFVFATSVTGVPWGVLVATGEAGGRAYVGEGLVDYAAALPDLLAGQLGAVAIGTSVIWTVVRLMTSRGGQRSARTDAVLFLMIPAVGQVLALGMISHGEPRFVFFPVALMAIVAALAGDEVRRLGRTSLYRTGVAATVMALVVSLGLHGDRIENRAEERAASFEVLVEAAAVIRAEAGGRCGVITGLEPQTTWLTRCATRPFADPPEIDFPSGVEVYLLLAEDGPRQPEGELLDEYFALTDGDPTVVAGEGSLGDVEIWRVAG